MEMDKKKKFELLSFSFVKFDFVTPGCMTPYPDNVFKAGWDIGQLWRRGFGILGFMTTKEFFPVTRRS